MAVDLLWADPDVNVRLFAPNHRGIGSIFGRQVIDRVRQKFGIDLIIRAHQVKFKSPSFDLLIANSLRAFSGGVGWIRILQWYANIWTHHNLHSSTLLRDVSSGIPFFICKSIQIPIYSLQV